MSVSQSIKQLVSTYKLGEVFSNEVFLHLGARTAVDKALSRLVKSGEIERVAQGVFVRPKKSRFVNTVMPETSKIIEVIARQNGETFQIHGAEAARRFKLTTQMPVNLVYYTNGSSRTIKVGNRQVKLIHTSSQKKLQHAGSKVGTAISALWYLGKETVTPAIITKIKNLMSEQEFKQLKEAKLPAWLQTLLEQSQIEKANA